MRAKFSELSYTGAAPKCCAQAGGEKEPWLTAEQIPVKGCYSAADLEGMEHLNYAAGVAPFLRGPSIVFSKFSEKLRFSRKNG